MSLHSLSRQRRMLRWTLSLLTAVLEIRRLWRCHCCTTGMIYLSFRLVEYDRWASGITGVWMKDEPEQSWHIWHHSWWAVLFIPIKRNVTQRTRRNDTDWTALLIQSTTYTWGFSPNKTFPFSNICLSLSVCPCMHSEVRVVGQNIIHCHCHETYFACFVRWEWVPHNNISMC